MNIGAMESMDLVLGTADRPQARRLLERMAHASGLALNIVRGRVTALEARYEIRLRGSHRKVAQALRLCRGEGVDLQVKEPGGP